MLCLGEGEVPRRGGKESRTLNYWQLLEYNDTVHSRAYTVLEKNKKVLSLRRQINYNSEN